MAVGDLNHDGKPDLVLTNWYTSLKNLNVGSVSVLLGNGDGTFQAPVSYSTGEFKASSVVIADLNGDGKPDLAVTNIGGVSILMGNGDGTFQPAVTYYLAGIDGLWGAIADLNGDGFPDLVVATGCEIGNCLEGGFSVLLGKGDGTFQPSVGYDSGGYNALWVALGDLNGDGHPDLVVANVCKDSYCATGGEISVRLGVGDGTFQAPVNYSSGGAGAWSVAIADVNGDGKPDLVVGNTGPTSAAVLLGLGDGIFQPAVTYGSYGCSSLVLADVNGDGKLDAITSGVSVQLGNGDGSFQPAIVYATPGAGSGSIAVADVNGDGKLDVLAPVGCTTKKCANGAVSVLLNNSGAPPTTTTLVSSPNPVNRLQKVTYTATVVCQSCRTFGGYVIFTDGSTTIASVALVNNQAAYTTSYTVKQLGTHPITATYSGDLHKAAGSTSATLTEYVRGPSATALATSGSSTFVGQPVTFTATVTATNGTIPDGEQIAFYDGTAQIGTGTTAGGVATFITSSLAAKTHTIKATYVGDNNFAPSSGTVKQAVQKYSTTTAIGSSSNPSSFGDAVTFTAQVTGAGPQPTGNVSFMDGSNALGSGKLSGGVAAITKSKLAVGTHPITAKYLGDGYNAASASPALQQVVE